MQGKTEEDERRAAVLAAAMLEDARRVPEDLAEGFVPLEVDERRLALREATAREGQGAFRLRLLRAYGGQCAITGEHTGPVLDAAHIQPYLGPRSNHVQNGLLLRGVPRLFDEGYVAVTPELRFEVSRRLKDDYENGRVYYDLDGAPLKVIPRRKEARPSRRALEWHASQVFR